MTNRQLTQQLDVPAAAVHFRAGPAKFAAPVEVDGVREIPVEILVRTADPIYSWYWGWIVHDMAGVDTKNSQRPIDWCHDDDEIMGVTSSISADAKNGLAATGKLVSVGADRAREVAAKGKAGVPYEASLDWSGPASIEYVEGGMSTEVNGITFQGPGYVVRQWQVNAVAICPHGADSNTQTSFAKSPRKNAVTLFSKSENLVMPTGTAPNHPAPPAPPAPAESRTEFQASLQKFVAKFGGENGSKWFSENLSFEACLEKQIDALNAQLKAKDDEITALAAKLKAADTGEEASKTDLTDGKPQKGKVAFASLVRVRT